MGGGVMLGIDANGVRGLDSAVQAPLPLNQGDFFAFTPVLVDFGDFSEIRPEDQTRTRRETRYRSDQIDAAPPQKGQIR